MPTNKIVPGKTTFRSTIADSNALWRVIRSKGRGVYLCEVENEKIEINGKLYDSDYAGTQKVFLTKEILGSLEWSDFVKSLWNDHDNFYASLKPGQIVHYHNSFDRWVRCEVVRKGDKTALKPIALVGEWPKHDLPKRLPDGSIYAPHHAKEILDGALFTPNASNLFEAGNKPRNGIAPTTLTPIDLSVPEITAEQQRIADLWKTIKAVKDLVQKAHESTPEKVLADIKAIVG